MTKGLIAAVVLAGSSGALGQAGWTITPIFAPGQTGITPRTPSCTIRYSARFSPNDHALAGVNFSALAAEGEWSGNTVLPPLTQGSNPGTINGPTVTGIIAGQLATLPVIPRFDPSNPIAVWEATWTTRDFEPRVVVFSTRTARFDVYPTRTSVNSQSRLSGLTEGSLQLEIDESCYPDCDTSTGPGSLDTFDFLCFLNHYDARETYACDCDTTTGVGVCDVFDFICFQNRFAAGCP